MNNPVLLVIFNRPTQTLRLLDLLREIKPPVLYIHSDGPRDNKENERDIVISLRDSVLKNIDWKCEVSTNFRSVNLGCGPGVSAAISWFFDSEEQGIILEDDCHPTKAFFDFTEILLDRYKDNLKVGHISGYNHYPGRIKNTDYFFTAIPGIWGWATWRNRWKDYEREIENFNYPLISAKIGNRAASFLRDIIRDPSINTWDYQWTYHLLKNNYLSIRPSENLVYNAGIGEHNNGTHTMRMNEQIVRNIPNSIISFNDLRSPVSIAENRRETKFFISNHFYPTIFAKLKRKIYAYIS